MGIKIIVNFKPGGHGRRVPTLTKPGTRNQKLDISGHGHRVPTLRRIKITTRF